MNGRQEGPVTVLAVDDQAIFRRAVRELVAAADGFQQVGEAATGPEAIAMAVSLHPDLILLDLRIPGMDGITTARRLAVEAPESTVVLVSLEEPPDLPSPIDAEGAPVHVRKQDLSVRTLREIWLRHGRHRHPA